MASEWVSTSADVVSESVQFALRRRIPPTTLLQIPSLSRVGLVWCRGLTPVARLLNFQSYHYLWNPTSSLSGQGEQDASHRLWAVTTKAIRDVWNLRSWIPATKPYWSDQDRQQYEDSLKNACKCAAASHDASLLESITLVGPLVCNPSATVPGAAASNASSKHADKSLIADSFESFEASIYCQPQLKLPRHSMSAAMPESSADSLFDAKEYPQDRLPPANLKFQRAVQQTCAWSNLVPGLETPVLCDMMWWVVSDIVAYGTWHEHVHSKLSDI